MAYRDYLHVLVDLTGTVYRSPGTLGQPNWPQTASGWRARPYKTVIQLEQPPEDPSEDRRCQLSDGTVYWNGLWVHAEQSIVSQAGVVALVCEAESPWNEWGLLGCYGYWHDTTTLKEREGISPGLRKQFLRFLREHSEEFQLRDQTAIIEQLDRAHLPEG